MSTIRKISVNILVISNKIPNLIYILMNTIPTRCHFYKQTVYMGCMKHHRNEPLESDIKSVCFWSWTSSH